MEAERINAVANTLADLAGRAAELRRYLDFDAKRARLAAIASELEDPKVWDDAKRAQELGKEKKALEAVVASVSGIDAGLRDAQELFEMARAEGDDATLVSIERDVAGLAKNVGDLEFRRMFADPLDPNSCFVDIQAGAGGTEAQDWAQMLERMYVKYAERRGFRVEILEQSEGEVAGIKTATLKVTGDYAYGSLRTETGIHRLVRKSPFDSNARRHTSFASVFVYPEVDESIAIDVNPADLRIDTYRASGAGGQHVNKTESAVRITHVPTGLVVQCQDEKSQLKNKSRAMTILRARLLEAEAARQADERASERRSQVGSGDRSEKIRTYNFPQSRITDHRAGVTVHQLEAVIEGALDELL
ncbi:MAG TPA: peptide chain release factor 2, partial [Burkholderiales bacterium]|nr:peptide chain release factor 2 [Burkholderiales bacterium]